MRLIDADALIKKLEEYAEDEWNKNLVVSMPQTLDEVCEIIEEQPTAYDIDKVVEDLDKNIEEYQKYNYPEDDYEFGFERGCEYAFEKAIEIVKQGVR